MPPHKAPRHIIEMRRQMVASGRAQGLSVREIVRALEDKLPNPKTGKAWSIGSIQGELTALEKEWKQRAAQEIDDHKGRLLAELHEVKRHAWRDKNFKAILGAITRELALLGVDTQKVNVDVGLNINASELLLNRINSVAARIGAPGSDQGSKS